MTDFDDQLRDELDRRVASVPTGRDWARHELLPGVLSGIDSRPQRLATSRAPAFVGLAAAAAIIVILVVAMPRLGIGPAATDSTSLAPTTTPPVAETLPILSTADFVSHYAARDLIGQSVLVDGAIDPNGDPNLGPDFECGPLVQCPVGALEGTDVLLSAKWIPVPEGEGVEVALGTDPEYWRWWSFPEAGPGALVLTLDRQGFVEFVGTVDPGETPRSATNASSVEPSLPAVGQAMIVNGWLIETEPEGSGLDIDCPAAEFPPVAALPTRYCQAVDFLADEPRNAADRAPLDSTDRLAVQRNAAQQFAPADTSQRSLYVVSPRLYGGGCEGEPRCYFWDVVARLSEPPLVERDPLPSPTPATREIPCSSDPISAVTITDETGLIALCEDAATPADGEAALNVENPDGDVYVLRITWAGVCSPSGRFTLRPSGDHFELVVFVPPTDVVCDGLPVSHDVFVYLDEPIPTSSLQTTFVEGPFVETPEETPPPLTPASWDLAPSERPTASSDRLGLFVHDPGCLEDPARPGRLLDPEVTYDESTVTITFFVDSGAGIPRCPASGSYRIEVLLDEPLGDRRLVDGGADVERVLSHDDGLMVVQPSDSLAQARARLSALLGDKACPTSADQLPPTDEAALTIQATGQLGAPEGIVGNRAAFWGSIDHAVTELDGFELYQGQDQQRYMLALADGQAWLHDDVKPGALVLADVSSISVDGSGSPIWVPGAHYQEFGSPDCDATVDVSGRLQASDSLSDFTISVGTDHVSNPAGDPLEGLDATLEYAGAESPLEIVGSGTAFAWMTFSRIDGDFTPAWGMTSDCHPYQVTSSEPYQLEFLSSNFSGGQSARLPAGLYRLDASAEFYVGGCPGPEVNLNASIFVRVR